MSTATPAPQFSDYSLAWRRQWRWVAASTVLFSLLGVAAATAVAPTYESTATVLLRPLSTDPLEQLRDADRIDTTTERQLALSTRLAAEAADGLDGSVDPLALREGLTVIATPEGAVLDFIYEAGDPQVAAQRAQAFADAYLADRAARADQALTEIRQDLDQRFEEVLNEERELLDELRPLLEDEDGDGEPDGDPGLIGQLEADLEVVRTRRGLLTNEQAETRLMGVDAGEVLSPAFVPSEPSGPPPPVLVAAAAVFGLVMGLFVALMVHRSSDVVTEAEQVSALFGAPTLGVVADRRPRARTALLEKDDVEPVMRRTAVKLLNVRPDVQTIVLLTSGSPEACLELATALVAGLERLAPASVVDATTDDGNGPWLTAEAVTGGDGHRVVVAASSLDESTMALELAHGEDCVVVPVTRLGHIRREDVLISQHDLQLIGADVPGVLVVGGDAT